MRRVHWRIAMSVFVSGSSSRQTELVARKQFNLFVTLKNKRQANLPSLECGGMGWGVCWGERQKGNVGTDWMHVYRGGSDKQSGVYFICEKERLANVSAFRLCLKIRACFH